MATQQSTAVSRPTIRQLADRSDTGKKKGRCDQPQHGRPTLIRWGATIKPRQKKVTFPAAPALGSGDLLAAPEKGQAQGTDAEGKKLPKEGRAAFKAQTPIQGRLLAIVRVCFVGRVGAWSPTSQGFMQQTLFVFVLPCSLVSQVDLGGVAT